LFATLACSAAPAAAQRETQRIGHFPNITHVQALVAHALSRQGKGWFEVRLGPDVKIEWLVYNAGPSAIEAIFAKALDVTYVGPNPAINGHVRARRGYPYYRGGRRTAAPHSSCSPNSD
jgi:NitT/TauT family transport system substrate-binding protein